MAFMTIPYIPLLICIIGLILFIAAPETKPRTFRIMSRIGEIAFFCGLLVLTWAMSGWGQVIVSNVRR